MGKSQDLNGILLIMLLALEAGCGANNVNKICRSPKTAARAFRIAVKALMPKDYAVWKERRIVLQDHGHYWLTGFQASEGQVGGGLEARVDKQTCNVYKFRRGQ